MPRTDPPAGPTVPLTASVRTLPMTRAARASLGARILCADQGNFLPWSLRPICVLADDGLRRVRLPLLRLRRLR
jgi:hypothetical protein